MNFLYYLNNSLADSGDLKYFWEYDASASSGNFVTGNIKTLDNSDEYDNFSLMFTFNRNSSNKSLILSNVNSGNSGFSFGFTDDNYLFVDNYNNSTYQTHVFKDINLGIKNTICFQKSENYFSLYNYDIVSHEISEREYFNFNNNFNLSGGDYLIGGNNYHPVISGAKLSGYFDQLCFLNHSYDENTLEKLFSGFLPQTSILASSVLTQTISEEKIDYPDGVVISGADYSSFYDLFLNFNSLIKSGSGAYIASITGQASGASLVASGNYGQENLLSPCSISGATSGYSYLDLIGPSGAYSFVDTVRYHFSNSGDIFISHNVHYNYSGYTPSGFNINHNFYNKWEYVDNYNSATLDTAYYDAYKMHGTINLGEDSLLLGTNSGHNPNKFTLEGTADYVLGAVITEEVPGRIYLNGEPTAFTVSGDYYTLNDTGISFGDKILYDTFSGINPLSYGLNGFCSGDFYPRASMLFSGENSWSKFYRLNRKEYKEVTNLNIYYGESVISNRSGESIDNLGSFWL